MDMGPTCPALKLSKKYICPDCGIKGLDINPDCPRCRARLWRREYYPKRNKNRINKGLCPNCGKPAVQGKKFCTSCLSKKALNERIRKKNLVAKGICPRCVKNHIKPGTTYCRDCTERARIMAPKYRAKKNNITDIEPNHPRQPRPPFKAGVFCFQKLYIAMVSVYTITEVIL